MAHTHNTIKQVDIAADQPVRKEYVHGTARA